MSGMGWTVCASILGINPAPRQAMLDSWMPHKHIPNAAGTIVLDQQHDWPLVDAEIFGGEPLLAWVEGVFESVGTPRSASDRRRICAAGLPTIRAA